MGALPGRLTTAFSCGVPVVEGWEFPSVRARRKATEDICSGLAKNARARWPGCGTLAWSHWCVNISAERREQGLTFPQRRLPQTALTGLHVPTCSPTIGGGGRKCRQPIVLCLGICGRVLRGSCCQWQQRFTGRRELGSWWRGVRGQIWRVSKGIWLSNDRIDMGLKDDTVRQLFESKCYF